LKRSHDSYRLRKRFSTAFEARVRIVPERFADGVRFAVIGT
jgi:hypothetical protein